MFPNWFRKPKRSNKNPLNRKLHVECLEDRRLLTEFVVTRFDLDLSDPNPEFPVAVHTLRSAINAANENVGVIDTVFIPAEFAGETITLTQSQPIRITEPVIIASPFGTTFIERGNFASTGVAFQFDMDLNTSTGVSQLSGFNIDGFTTGIVVLDLKSNDSLLITDNTLQDNTSNGIEIIENSFDIIEISDNLITDNQRGIYMHGPTSQSNFNGDLYIGPSTSGGQNTIRNNSVAGIEISGYNPATTPHTITIASNTIYNNGFADSLGAGVYILDVHALLTISGNVVGLNSAGDSLPNQRGIVIVDNDVTGASRIENNFISGNTGDGLFISGAAMPALDIKNNAIGINASSVSRPNGGEGIEILQSSFANIVGNTVATNGGDGILLSQVTGGTVGTTVSGQGNTIILNQGDGIEFRASTANISVEGNTISSNTGAGIHLRYDAGTGNGISDNIFSGNGGLPLDLESANGVLGFTANDPNDADTGPNSLQNYVDLSSPVFSGGEWGLTARVDVTAVGDYYVEFYRYNEANKSYIPIKDSPGNLKWNILQVAALNSTAGSTFDGTFPVTFGSQFGVVSGDKITAILIPLAAPNNSSEFSPPLQLGDTAGPRITNITLDGTTWARTPFSFKNIIETTGDQLRPIATQNVNTLQIEFNEHVRKRSGSGIISDIDATVLELKRTKRNSDGTIINESVSATGFSYDPWTHVGTWTFPDLVDGKYAIHLNAAFTNVAGVADAAGNFLNADWNNNPSGTPDSFDDPARLFTSSDNTNGSARNEFRFHFALLKGDYNGDGIVNTTDTVNSSNIYSDGNGDGFFTTGPNSDITVRDSNLNKFLPFRASGSADLDDNEAVDGEDLAIWQTGYGGTTAGDVDGDGDSDGRDFFLWQSSFGSYSAWGDPPAASYAAAFAASLGLTLEELTTGFTPQVLNVIISGSTSTHASFSFDTVDGSGSQLATVPVGLADTISIVFSENVNVSVTSLIVVGLTTANVPEHTEFSYDPLTSTATWRFEGWALGDNYLLYLSDSITDTEGNFLDGEWTNPASITTTNSLVSEFPSGDGVSGGAFSFVMTLLPGDANLDGVVNSADYTIWTSNTYGGQGTKLFTQGDFDGNGTVNTADVYMLYETYGIQLRTITILADLNADGKVDATDLAVITANYGLTGATRADGDLNGNGTVGDSDLDLAFAQMGLDLWNVVA